MRNVLPQVVSPGTKRSSVVPENPRISRQGTPGKRSRTAHGPSPAQALTSFERPIRRSSSAGPDTQRSRPAARPAARRPRPTARARKEQDRRAPAGRNPRNRRAPAGRNPRNRRTPAGRNPRARRARSPPARPTHTKNHGRRKNDGDGQQPATCPRSDPHRRGEAPQPRTSARFTPTRHTAWRSATP